MEHQVDHRLFNMDVGCTDVQKLGLLGKLNVHIRVTVLDLLKFPGSHVSLNDGIDIEHLPVDLAALGDG